MLYRLIFISLILQVSACGFYLKGENQLSPQLQLMHVLESDDPEFNALLLQQLKISGVKVVDDLNAVLLGVQLQILPEITLAKSSSSGLLIKQLKVRINYFVKKSDGKSLIDRKQLEQLRDFESDTNQLLAKNNEKQQLYREMKQNLVRTLIFQLQTKKINK